MPYILRDLDDYWSLTDIKPVDNMTYNYAAIAVRKNKLPVVLKISCDNQLILSEFKALKYFEG